MFGNSKSAVESLEREVRSLSLVVEELREIYERDTNILRRQLVSVMKGQTLDHADTFMDVCNHYQELRFGPE